MQGPPHPCESRSSQRRCLEWALIATLCLERMAMAIESPHHSFILSFLACQSACFAAQTHVPKHTRSMRKMSRLLKLRLVQASGWWLALFCRQMGLAEVENNWDHRLSTYWSLAMAITCYDPHFVWFLHVIARQLPSNMLIAPGWWIVQVAILISHGYSSLATGLIVYGYPLYTHLLVVAAPFYSICICILYGYYSLATCCLVTAWLIVMACHDLWLLYVIIMVSYGFPFQFPTVNYWFICVLLPIKRGYYSSTSGGCTLLSLFVWLLLVGNTVIWYRTAR